MNSYEIKLPPAQDDDLPRDKDGRILFSFTDDPGRIHSSELPEYIDILLEDDVEKFKSMTPARLYKYVHGQFEYKSLKVSQEYSDFSTETFEVPFNIAVGYCADKIVKEFINQGCDVCRLDCGSANILHVLSICAAERYRPEDDYVNICNSLLEDVLTEDQFRMLCLQENEDGIRPMELAAKLGAFGIFRCIILHRGYICGEGRPKGMVTVSSYDISVYENCKSLRRFFRSPLRYMVFVSRSGMESLSKYKIMELPVFRKWLRIKIRTTVIFLCLWWIFRLTYIIMVSFLDPNVILFDHMCGDDYKMPAKRPDASVDVGASSRFNQCSKLEKLDPDTRRLLSSVASITWAWSLIMMLIDIIEFLLFLLHRDRHRAYRKTHGRVYAVYTPVYRISQFLLYFLNVIAVPISRSMSGGHASRVLLNIKAAQLPLCLMSFLYVVEFLPMLGIFAITLQRMLKSMIVFLVFLLPVKVVFSAFFMFFDTTNRFSNMPNGVYHLFLMDMGSMDFGENPRTLVQVVHVFYFLVMLILLFNYLIAVLSIIADEVGTNKRIYVDLRRLQMISLVEQRVTFWLWKLIYKFKPRKPIVIHAMSPLPEKEKDP